MPDGQIRGLQQVIDRPQAPLPGAHVDVNHPGLARSQGPQAYLAGHVNELLQGGVAAPVVGQGHLDPQDLRNKGHVVLEGAGDRGRRHVIGAGEAVGGNALLVQRLGSGQQVFRTSRGAVGAQHAHRRGDPGGGEVGEGELGHPAAEAALSAAAGEVDVLIHQTGQGGKPAAVHHLHIGQGGRQALSHGSHDAAAQEQIAETLWLRIKQIDRFQ